ncbi:STAS/SEC14 domain-containing protein [Gordonia rhizosphera]|uniref:STAS/SEC14 domain-containing protein n=1 Tax=Gordonia rhizosphera NBRC 16068 TaxID=1108045 RepID=K6UZS1_9ACTN|nr:STAS/SEC14 domain-containing protein [Gordonia rhizosphera]GAB89043.1 hypothetical protein GORHZ_048_00200 [Gordonia rhizosphera NBRC 16068]
MFTVVKEQGPNVIVEAEGMIHSSDYDVLTPTLEGVVKEHGHANLMIIAEGLKGETPRAMTKDAEFGFGVYKDVKKFALVSDETWLRVAVHMMSPFTGTEEKVFGLDERADAEAWLTA